MEGLFRGSGVEAGPKLFLYKKGFFSFLLLLESG